MQTIAVCRLTRKADPAIISLEMKYHFMEGRFCLVSLLGNVYLKSVCTYSQEIPRGGDVTFGAQKSRIRELRRGCEMNLRQF